MESNQRLDVGLSVEIGNINDNIWADNELIPKLIANFDCLTGYVNEGYYNKTKGSLGP